MQWLDSIEGDQLIVSALGSILATVTLWLGARLILRFLPAVWREKQRFEFVRAFKHGGLIDVFAKAGRVDLVVGYFAIQIARLMIALTFTIISLLLALLMYVLDNNWLCLSAQVSYWMSLLFVWFEYTPLRMFYRSRLQDALEDFARLGHLKYEKESKPPNPNPETSHDQP